MEWQLISANFGFKCEILFFCKIINLVFIFFFLNCRMRVCGFERVSIFVVFSSSDCVEIVNIYNKESVVSLYKWRGHKNENKNENQILMLMKKIYRRTHRQKERERTEK